MLEEMPLGWYLDWQRFGNQFNLSIARDDLHWGLWLSMYYNAHKKESAPEKRPCDMMPYYDEYAEDDSFIETMQAAARELHQGG
jgi:hypothetical protein